MMAAMPAIGGEVEMSRSVSFGVNRPRRMLWVKKESWAIKRIRILALPSEENGRRLI